MGGGKRAAASSSSAAGSRWLQQLAAGGCRYGVRKRDRLRRQTTRSRAHGLTGWICRLQLLGLNAGGAAVEIAVSSGRNHPAAKSRNVGFLWKKGRTLDQVQHEHITYSTGCRVNSMRLIVGRDKPRTG